MTREIALRELTALLHEYDTEAAHLAADEILCALLIQVGYADVVAEWEKIGKWYS
jgi:hypothetical protein